jgi:hypothetical protein
MKNHAMDLPAAGAEIFCSLKRLFIVLGKIHHILSWHEARAAVGEAMARTLQLLMRIMRRYSSPPDAKCGVRART